MGKPEDVLLGFSLFGSSQNVIEALKAARTMNIQSISMLGADGGALRRLSDVALVVPSQDGQHIHDVHMLLMHLISELIGNWSASENRSAGELVGSISLLPEAWGGQNKTASLELQSIIRPQFPQ